MKKSSGSKILGVIGGMGSQATAYFFNELIAHTDATSDQDHVDAIILNHATIPDRTQAILSGNHETFLQAIIDDAQSLESLGVDTIAIPCNTSHYFSKEIQSSVKIPIINMVEESMKAAAASCGTGATVGIFATDGTIKTGLYEQAAKKYGLKTIVPNEQEQKEVMAIIYDQVKKGKKGDVEKLSSIIDSLTARGAQCSVIACTELSYLKADHPFPSSCIDALDILVKTSIEAVGKKYRD